MKRLLLAMILIVLLSVPVSAATYLSAYDAYKVMHLHMNGTNGGTSFVDETGKTVTRVTSPNTQITPRVFGNASAYNDGSGYLKLADSADWSMGSGDFTILMWVYPSASGSSMIFFGQSDATATAASRQNQLSISATGYMTYDYWNTTSSGRTTLTSSITAPINRWYQVVVVKNGSTFYVYQNGVQIATGAMLGSALQDATGKFGLFATGEYTGDRFNGYLDEVVMWKGVAIPIENIYPETEEVGTTSPTTLTTSFTQNATSGSTSSVFQFNDTSSGTPSGWSWMFGDETFTNPWYRNAATSLWSARQDMVSGTNPDGSIVLFGGVASSTEKNDTYMSQNNGTTWFLMDTAAPWVARDSAGMVTNTTGAHILFGGFTAGVGANDTWVSIDGGRTWSRSNATGGWLSRYGMGYAILPNNNIVLTSGTIWDPAERVLNDTWRSTDHGYTWTLVNSSPPWEKMQYPTMISTSNGTLVLISGVMSPNGSATSYHYTNNTYTSVDGGSTWQTACTSCGWSNRTTMEAIALPDDTIMLVGGGGPNNQVYNDTWISKDIGKTWTRTNTSAGWTARWGMNLVKTINGSVLLMGGVNSSTSTMSNDVWQIQPATSFIQNATHQYSSNGVYNVALTGNNQLRFNTSLASSLITISSGTPSNTLINSFSANKTSDSIYAFPVQFTDASTSGTINSWNWSFGDGYYSNLQNPFHYYMIAGTYDVALNVTNTSGSYNASTKTGYITLTSDDDIYLRSWLHWNTSVTADEKGVAWSATTGSSTPSIDTTNKKFGAGSLYIRTGNNYISSPPSSIWDRSLIAGEIEFWVNISSVGDANKPIVKRSTGSGVTNGWGFINTNGTNYGWSWYEGSTANVTDGVYIQPNVWTHVLVSRNSSNYESVYVNGVLKTSKLGMYGGFDTANPVQIGGYGPGTEHEFRIDEFRFSQGTIRVAQSFNNSLMTQQYKGSLSGSIDPNPNSTLRYKTDPTGTAIIYNQTGGGMRNRTIQIQNITEATHVIAAVDFPPLYEAVKNISVNKSTYSDLTLVSSSIDSVNGVAAFNVTRTGGNITSLFDNRTSLVDVQILYYNYTSDANASQYFAYGYLLDGGSNAVHNFIMTPVTFGEWSWNTNFSATNTTPAVSETVSFGFTGTGYPNRWNWSWGDGTWTNGSTTNSTTHAYSTPGTYNVSMFSYLYQNESINTTQTRYSYINVSAAPNYNVMDMYQTGSYVRTVHVVDSDATPLSGASVVWSDGSAATTDAAGYCNVTLTAGIYTVITSLSGYYTDQLSVAVEGDGTTTVTLTKQTSYTGISLEGTPKDVKFHIQSFWGAPIYNANVSIQGVSTTTGNWDWLAVLLSISLGETPINTTEMSGFTDTNGDVVFLMLDTIKYNVTVSASGYTFPTMIISPQASQYTISANMNQSWFSSGNNTLQEVNVSVSWVSHNETYSFMNITYDDQTATTTGGTIYVYKDSVGRVANQSPYASMDIVGSSCSNSTLLEVPVGGSSYRVDVNATTSTGNNIVRTFTHHFKGSPVLLPGFTQETLLWLALFIIFFTAAFAGATHSPQMAIVLCVESWVFWAIGWLDGLITEFWYGETAVFGYLVLATFITIWWNIQEGKAKGKRSS